MSTFATDAAKTSASGQVDDSTPLNDAERKMVSRLLSDPFSFPLVFKTWLVAFLEGSDLTLPLGSISGLNTAIGDSSGRIFQLLPAGMLFDYAGGAVPTNCLLCNGQSLLRDGTYNRLFRAIGTTWGAVDSTHFYIPDIRDRVAIGTGTANALGQTDGVAEASRPFGPSHRHSFTDTKSGSITGGATSTAGGHQHSLGNVTNKAVNAADSDLLSPATTGPGSFFTDSQGSHSHSVSGSVSITISGNTSGSASAVDRPCFAVVTKIINY